MPLNSRSLSNELILIGSRYCSRQELAEAVELVAQGRIRSIVTRLCWMEEAEEVLQSIEGMEQPGRACAVLP